MKRLLLFGGLGLAMTLLASAFPAVQPLFIPAYESLAYVPSIMPYLATVGIITVAAVLLFGLGRQAALFAIAALYYSRFSAFRQEVTEKLTGRLSLV